MEQKLVMVLTNAQNAVKVNGCTGIKKVCKELKKLDLNTRNNEKNNLTTANFFSKRLCG